MFLKEGCIFYQCYLACENSWNTCHFYHLVTGLRFTVWPNMTSSWSRLVINAPINFVVHSCAVMTFVVTLHRPLEIAIEHDVPRLMPCIFLVFASCDHHVVHYVNLPESTYNVASSWRRRVQTTSTAGLDMQVDMPLLLHVSSYMLSTVDIALLTLQRLILYFRCTLCDVMSLWGPIL